MTLTTLDALLLFLVGQKGQSGYDIRQLMASTPLGLFSDSPGAIYPALARLETRGLLSSSAEPEGRRKRLYEQTEAGRAGLKVWLARPVDLEAVTRRPEALDLRYVMIAETLGREAALRFTRECLALERSHLAELEAFQAGPGQAMSQAPRESTELGVRLLRTRLQWRRELLAKEGA
jgi:DNA-binding PadR family transcriptional regulator